MLWSSDAVEHDSYYGDSGHWTQSNMNAIMAWAWMLWSSDAVKHECSGHRTSDAVEHELYYCLGMDALVIGCSRMLLWLGHGCFGHQVQL